MRNLIKTVAVVAALALASAPARAEDPLARYDNHATTGMTRVPGPTYVNRNYGFSVRLPSGQVGWMNTAPSPNHGLAVFLRDHSSIVIDASFDSVLLGSTAALAEEVKGYVTGSRDQKSSTVLDRRSAERIVQDWPGSNRRRVVVARWDDAGGPDDAINFTLTLVTTTANYGQDTLLFDTIVKSFRFRSRKT